MPRRNPAQQRIDGNPARTPLACAVIAWAFLLTAAGHAECQLEKTGEFPPNTSAIRFRPSVAAGDVGIAQLLSVTSSRRRERRIFRRGRDELV
jgi:hypothetical protein